MQIIPDAVKIKRWREERCWSQEHLADLSGISLRTIQRMENGDRASRESVMALAAAFNVDVIDLTVNAQSQEQITVYKKRANTMAAARLSFWISLASYVFGMILFAVLSVGDGSRGYVMLWPSIWWTVAMAGHGLTVIIVLLVMRYHNQQDGFTG